MKKALAPVLHRLAWRTGISTVKTRALKVGRILSFHGVDDGFYPAANFETHLRYLARHFSIVSLVTLLERMNSPQGLTNEIALTFDDGLRNNFTTAYPLLKQFNTPATFFICPGLIENGRWLWTHEARARLALLTAGQLQELERQSPTRQVGVHALACSPDKLKLELQPQSAEPKAAAPSIEAFVERMKGFDLQTRTAAEDDLRRRTASFKPTETQRQRYDLMSWDEVRQLDPALITIGSHSLTHPILSTLTGVELAVEIAESRRMLENRLQRAAEFFCYPNGSHNPEVVRRAAENYRAAVTTEAGFAQRGSDLHQLPRIGITPGLAHLAWRLHRPGA